MPKQIPTKSVYRIIDANINRAKEGLRVLEEVGRFLLDSPALTAGFKKMRHELDKAVAGLPLVLSDLWIERDSASDVGKDITVNELKRKGTRDVFIANMQRVKESARVLEEFSKLLNVKSAVRFKNIRYRLYEIEKSSGRFLHKLS